MDKQIRVYAPGGDPLGTVFDELKCELSIMGRGQSTGSLVVPAWSEANRWLENSLAIVALEVFVNGKFVEPPNARFTCTGWERDSRDRSGGGALARTYELTSIAWVLKGASPGLPIVSNTPQFTNEKGDTWTFDNQTPGTILRTLFDAANALNATSFGGWGQALSKGTWSQTHDSDGTPWQFSLDFEFDLEKNMWDCLDELYARGVIDWELEAGVVSIRNPRSRTYEQSGKALTALRLTEMDDATERNRVSDLVNHVMVRGVDLTEGQMNAWWEFYDESSTGVYGGLTKVVQAGGVMTEGAASLLAQQIFELNGRPQLEITRAYNHLNVNVAQPFIDYAVGEWVAVERLIRNLGSEDAILEPYRVVKIHLADNDQVQLTLGTLQEDLNQYLARMVAAATGGGLISDTGTSKPPKAPDSAQPAQVTGLNVQSFARPGSGGYYIGGAFARWAPVTLSTVGAPIDLVCYEVQIARLVSDGVEPVWGEMAQVGGIDYQSEEIPPGERVGVRVRAVSKAQVRGVWSVPGFATVVKDLVPPPPSSKPLLETAAGTVTVRTDGKTQDGSSMPFDFSHRIVQRSPISTSSWVAIGELSERTLGFTIDGPLTAKAGYQYRFLSVDTEGNVSEPSLAASITVASIEDDPIYRASRDAAIAKADAAQKTADSKNKFFPESTTAPVGTTETPLVVGDLWPHRTVDGVVLKRWDGSTWMAISATADVNAAKAAADAAAAAVQETRTIEGMRSTTSTAAPPTATATVSAGYPTPSTWTQINSAGATVAAFRWTGSAWVNQPLDPVYIPILDVNTATIGMLDSPRIKASWLQAGELVISDATNMIQNGDFGGTPFLHSPSGSNTIVPVTSWPSPNSPRTGSVGGAELTWQAGGNIIGCLLNGTIMAGGTIQKQHQPVVFGEEYFASVWIRTWSGAGSTVQKKIRVYQYSSTGSFVTYSDSPLTTVTNAWTELSLSVKITNPSTKYLVVAVASAALPTDTPSIFRICDAYMVQKGTGRLIVDGSVTVDTLAAGSVTTPKIATDAVDTRTIAAGAVTAVAIAAKAVTAVKIDVASLAADTAFINYLGANTILAGAIEAKIIDSDVFNGKTFNGGTFNGQTVNAVTINGADINLISQTYGSGKLRIQVAGSTRAVQLDSNGLHVLNGVAKWVSLNSGNRRLEFFGAGQGEVWIEGTQADIRVTSDVRGDNSKYSGLVFDTKHAAGDVRLRSAGVNVQAGGLEVRFESSHLQGATAFGSGVFVGYGGNQDAVGIGNIHPEAVAGKVGMRFTISNSAAEIVNNGDGFPGMRVDNTQFLVGGWPGRNSPVGYMFGQVNKVQFGINGQNAATSYMQGDLDRWRIVAGIEVLVGTNLRTTGSFSSANKFFEIVHPDPAKAGMILRHAATESPWNGVEYWSHDAPVTVGDDGSVFVTLPDYVPHLTHPFLTVMIQAHGTTPGLFSYLQETGGFRVYGTPGSTFVWVAKAVRKDTPQFVVEELDLDKAIDINDMTPGSSEVQDGLLGALESATDPSKVVLAEVAGAISSVGV